MTDLQLEVLIGTELKFSTWLVLYDLWALGRQEQAVNKGVIFG